MVSKALVAIMAPVSSTIIELPATKQLSIPGGVYDVSDVGGLCDVGDPGALWV